MMTPTFPNANANAASAAAKPEAPQGSSKTESLVPIVVIGLVVGVAASLLGLTAPFQRAPQPMPAASANTAALPPLPRPEESRVVTASGEVTSAGVTGIADSLLKDGPIADPGGFTPKPRSGALFHRMTDGPMVLRVYTANGSPETVMTAYAKDLEAAGFEREDSGTPVRPGRGETEEGKPDPRGRIRRVYSKKNTESLITVARGEGGQTLVTIVEQPKRGEP